MKISGKNSSKIRVIRGKITLAHCTDACRKRTLRRSEKSAGNKLLQIAQMHAEKELSEDLREKLCEDPRNLRETNSSRLHRCMQKKNSAKIREIWGNKLPKIAQMNAEIKLSEGQREKLREDPRDQRETNSPRLRRWPQKENLMPE